jgi:hypothetical protein
MTGCSVHQVSGRWALQLSRPSREYVLAGVESDDLKRDTVNFQIARRTLLQQVD